jgi:membrane protein
MMSTGEAPSPQPEITEPKLRDPGLGSLSARDYGAVFVRAGKEALDDHLTNLAAALAYYAFLAIPALLLVVVGAFSLFAGPDAVSTIVDKLSGVIPREAVTLVDDALSRVTEQQAGTGVTMAVVGLVLALWSLTGAMQTLMWALNEAYDRDETRGFVKRRVTGLLMVLLLISAFALAFGLLVLGPHLSGWIGSATGAEALVEWLWWTAQWPILVFGLLLAFATILYLGPDVDHPRWSFLTIGTGLAVVVWLAASGAFAVYASRFGSYDKILS